MPELPEVETVRRGLEVELVGHAIVEVDVLVPKVLRLPFNDPKQFKNKLENRIVQSVSRRGKHLILGLENGYSLAAHLKMRGHMLVCMTGACPDEKYLCVRMRLDNGREWRFYDMWTWGELRLLPVEVARVGEFVDALARMGPEPLGDEFTPNTFLQAAQKSPKRAVKAFLLDQNVVAGVGNIYADESLSRAGINPKRPVSDLSELEWDNLLAQVRAVIGEAVEQSGTISDNFVDVEGSAGRYEPRVYGRHGEQCDRCGNTLQRTIIAGRGTAYCETCQPISVLKPDKA